MQINKLSSGNSAKSKKRVGRGGKRGTYSGRGGKGQTARAGRNFRPIIRDILKRYPKLRGYRNRSAQIKPEIVNLKTLDTKFQNGQTVNPRILVAMNLACRVSGKYPQIKILGNGNLSKKLRIEGCQASSSAREKIEKAGGEIISSARL